MNLKRLQELEPWEWPPNAGATFLKTLRDLKADPNDRLLAAKLAGESSVINDEIAAALLSVVADRREPESLRAKAAIALGPAIELGDEAEFDEALGLDDTPISKNTFNRINKSLRDLYLDNNTPKYVRRRILEASVRAPQNWHAAAVRSVYASDDEDWKLTAVFCMQYIKGFEDEIVDALESPNSAIRYHAVCAAGNWELDAAWRHVVDLVESGNTGKPLLLAAIDAIAAIRPREARNILGDLTDDDDEDISEAVFDALGMAEGRIESEFEDDGEDFFDDFDDEDFEDGEDFEDDEDDDKPDRVIH